METTPKKVQNTHLKLFETKVISKAYVDGPNVQNGFWELTIRTSNPHVIENFEFTTKQLAELKDKLNELDLY